MPTSDQCWIIVHQLTVTYQPSAPCIWDVESNGYDATPNIMLTQYAVCNGHLVPMITMKAQDYTSNGDFAALIKILAQCIMYSGYHATLNTILGQFMVSSCNLSTLVTMLAQHVHVILVCVD